MWFYTGVPFLPNKNTDAFWSATRCKKTCWQPSSFVGWCWCGQGFSYAWWLEKSPWQGLFPGAALRVLCGAMRAGENDVPLCLQYIAISYELLYIPFVFHKIDQNPLISSYYILLYPIINIPLYPTISYYIPYTFHHFIPFLLQTSPNKNRFLPATFYIGAWKSPRRCSLGAFEALEQAQSTRQPWCGTSTGIVSERGNPMP